MRNQIHFILLLGISLYSGNLLASNLPRLVGILHPHPGWAGVLYVQAVSDMENAGGVDSIIPDSEGNFTYQFTDREVRSGVVRLWICPVGAPRNTYLEGPDENQCFLVIPPPGEDLIWEGDADGLFYSYRLNSSELNHLTIWMRDLKIPFRNWMEAQRGLLTADSGAILPLRPVVYEQWLDLLEEYRHRIAQKLKESLPDPIKLLGLYYLYRSNLGRYDPGFYQKVLATFHSRHWTLYQRISKDLRAIKNSSTHPFLPGIPLLDTAERLVTLHSFLGNYMVLDFWASWCGPCRFANRVSLPKLSGLLQQENISFISVSVDHDQEKWLSALREDAPSWPQYRDQASDYSLKEYFSINSYPTYLIFDHRGRHVYTSHADADLQRFLIKEGRVRASLAK